jgi:hypothetical protein
MLGHLDRQTAARYSAFAAAPIVLGVLAAGWALRGGTVDHAAKVNEQARPPEPPAPEKPAPGPETPAPTHTAADASSIAARFDAIKNRPVPLVAEGSKVEDLPPPPPTPPSDDLKYVGPVHLGPTTLAILRADTRQITTSKGRSFTYASGEDHHTVRVVEVTDGEVTVEEAGIERKITRADTSGEVVSFLGSRPGKTKAPVIKKKIGGPKAGGGDAQANAEYQAKKSRVLQELAPMLDRIAKSNPTIARELRDKAAARLKQEGLDPSVIDEHLGAMGAGAKTDKGGEH